jgi:hypothetical protein
MKLLKAMCNQCMNTSSLSNVIYVIIRLSNTQMLKDTFNASMKNTNSTNVEFATRALDKKKILITMYNLCMKTSDLSNVINVIIQLSYIQTLENI